MQRKWRARMRAAKLKRKKETRAERAVVPAYTDIVAARDTVLREAIAHRQVRVGHRFTFAQVQTPSDLMHAITLPLHVCTALRASPLAACIGIDIGIGIGIGICTGLNCVTFYRRRRATCGGAQRKSTRSCGRRWRPQLRMSARLRRRRRQKQLQRQRLQGAIPAAKAGVGCGASSVEGRASA